MEDPNRPINPHFQPFLEVEGKQVYKSTAVKLSFISDPASAVRLRLDGRSSSFC